MEVKAKTLSNIMFGIMVDALEGELSSTKFGKIEMGDFDEAEFALAIKRIIAEKKKRIVIDITYD